MQTTQITRFPAPGTANAFAPSAVLKGGPGTLISLMVYNTNAADRYLLVFDATSLPANGTVPMVPPVKIPTKSTASVDVPWVGIIFQTGMVAALSSTDTTLTIVAGNDGLFLAQLR